MARKKHTKLSRSQVAYLEEVYKECLKLEHRKDLTQYGAGRGDLAMVLLGKKRKGCFKTAK